MKKVLFALLLLASPLSFAQEAKGIIEEIHICGTGNRGHDMYRTLQFKIEDKWFGIWADFGGVHDTYDDSLSASMIFMAYSQNAIVHVKATHGWEPEFKKCGVSDGKGFGRQAGDFIRLSR